MTRAAPLALMLLAACTVAPGAVVRPPAGVAVAARLHLGPPAQGVFPVPGQAADPAALALVEVLGQPLRLSAVCDGPARFRPVPDPPDGAPAPDPAWVRAGQGLHADLGAGTRGRLVLDLGAGTGGCELTVDPPGAPAHILALRRQGARLDALDQGAPRCDPPPGGDALEGAFAAPRALSLTCPMTPGPWRLLPDALAAFDAKVQALTGRPLGPVLALGDPDIPLDFSNAPDLDLIVLSYLNLNADYTGALMARMLEHHAARGTQVRILVADPMWGGAERALFEGLAARHPNVRLEPWRYAPRPGDGTEDQVGRIHRVQHVKLFAVIARDLARSVAMIGGRNLADGYVFAQPFDLSAHPELRQYDPEQSLIAGGFHAYQDLEVAFTGPAQVQALVAHWAELWNREPATDRPRAGAAPRGTPATGPRMRHFLSVPWADGGALTGLFADLIDAARVRIDIASPYLNPPPQVAAALARAVARGVQVRVLTTERVREAGDPFITGLNRMFAADWAGRLSVLDHDPHPRLLHTKAMVIDGRLVVLGSVNLNLRSFVHDWENGVMVLDPGLARAVTALIDGYAAQAHPIAPDAPVAGFARVLLGWPLFRRAF